MYLFISVVLTIFFVFNFQADVTYFTFWSITTAFLASFQGFFAALFYCFCNKEVGLLLILLLHFFDFFLNSIRIFKKSFKFRMFHVINFAIFQLQNNQFDKSEIQKFNILAKYNCSANKIICSALSFHCVYHQIIFRVVTNILGN